MNSNNLLNFIRPLASALACASLPISILGWPDLSNLGYVLVPAVLGWLVSFLYLRFLSCRPWVIYASANILTLWAILTLIVILMVTRDPISLSDLIALPVLAGIGSLALYRQVILAIIIFVGIDLSFRRFIKKEK